VNSPNGTVRSTAFGDAVAGLADAKDVLDLTKDDVG